MTAWSGQALNGKRVVVTGAASGIGRAAAELLAENGGQLLLVDRDGAKMAALCEELSARNVSVTALVSDVLALDLPDKIMQAQAGQVDVLVNSAGILDGFLPTDEMDDETWRRVIDVNVTAPMRLMRAILPGMRQRGGGTIVNISSIAGIRGIGGGSAYISSKHALVGLTRHAAAVYGPDGVRCNAVAPGAIITDLDVSMRTAWAEERIRLQGSLMPTPARASEVASTVLWLASDASANVNGSVVNCDGGWSVL